MKKLILKRVAIAFLITLGVVFAARSLHLDMRNAVIILGYGFSLSTVLGFALGVSIAMGVKK